MADAQQGRPGNSEPAGESVIEGQRQCVGAAIVMVVVIHRTILPIMLMTCRRMRLVVVVTAGHRPGACLGTADIRSEDADIQPGQHGKNHQPCE